MTWTIGAHYFIWAGDTWSGDPLFEGRVRHLATLGYRAIELPILHPHTAFDLRRARHICTIHRLDVIVSTAPPPASSLIEPGQQQAGLEWLRHVVGCAATLGAQTIAGPLCSPVGDLPSSGGRRHYRTAAGPLRELAALAAEEAITLAIEPLNRFETDVLGTFGEAAELATETGCKVCADSFHANIEENDPVAALRQLGPLIGHVHLSENHRGPIGTGHLAWDDWFAALESAGYAGPCVVESFNGVVAEIAQATRMWRALSVSPEDFCARSMDSLKTYTDERS